MVSLAMPPTSLAKTCNGNFEGFNRCVSTPVWGIKSKASFSNLAFHYILSIRTTQASSSGPDSWRRQHWGGVLQAAHSSNESTTCQGGKRFNTLSRKGATLVVTPKWCVNVLPSPPPVYRREADRAS